MSTHYQPVLWRVIQKTNFTDWGKLVEFLELNLAEAEKKILSHSRFPLNLPLRLARKIVKGDWEDPILKQFLPTQQEVIDQPLFVSDPVDDTAFSRTPKLLHKYRGRALLLCTSACAMNCRYCFRQHYPYETEKTLFQEEIAAINADPTLSEIILSGGDPLSLSNNALEMLLMSLSSIPHVKRIRFHTRFPLGIPERIDEEFLSILSRASKQIVFVIHCNHTNECDDDIFKALKSVQRLGIPILSQSVLLRGVNDSLSALKELFETLSNQGIIPYYLHQLDRVQGAAHFEVSEEKGLKLIEELTAQLSGYAVPKYVREVPHLPNKSPVSHSIECLQP